MPFARFDAPMMTLFQPDYLYAGGRMQAGAGLLVDAQGKIVRVMAAEEPSRLATSRW